MKKRLEYKYLVPESLLDSLRHDMMNYLTCDPFTISMPDKAYVVRSIYLDTRGYKCYYDKAEGLASRSKFRVRGYNSICDESIVFLEIKRKNKDYILKNRSRLYYHNLHDLFRTNDVPGYILSDKIAERENAVKFMYYYHLYNLTPAFLIIYNREAYQCRFGSDLRITFDKNVRGTPSRSLDELYNENNLKSSWPGFFIMEVKFSNMLPSWFPQIITKYGLQRVSASKYAMCFEIHRGIKRNDNKFQRILTNP